jgi:hypothetical protein
MLELLSSQSCVLEWAEVFVSARNQGQADRIERAANNLKQVSFAFVTRTIPMVHFSAGDFIQ